jgi:transglutaminase-like putative cysteine protease
MRLQIRHRTTLRYDQPVGYAIQVLRMMPRRHDGQQIEDWSITVAGRRQPLPGQVDGYGNWVHLHSRNGSHELTDVVVSGVVEVSDRGGLVSGADEPVPARFYLRQSASTRPDEAMTALAHGAGGAGEPLDRLHRLSAVIAARVAPEPAGVPLAHAHEALAAGKGGVADVVHLMLGCARLLGIPARYVAGYRHEGEGGAPRESPHAWIEAYVDGTGWVAFDPLLGERVGDRHVRVAVGPDYWAAAPVRGTWRGAAEEAQTVAVQVAAAEMTQ